MYHQGRKNNEERRARLASFVLYLFPNIMRCSLLHFMREKELSNKYCNNKRIPPVLTPTELLLIKELPKVENFTIQLCYKLISFEELLPTPSNGWGKFPDDKALALEDDIERIRHATNEILAINDDECTDNYLVNFFYQLEQIIQRLQIALGNTSIFETYKSLRIKNTDTAFVLAKIRNVGVIASDVQHVKLQDRERYSKISAVITEFFPKILRNLIPSFYSPSIVYNMCAQPGCKWDKSQELQINNLQSSLSFESLDISILYQLFRRFSFVPDPTPGWGNTPSKSDIIFADDIERIRLLRNKSVHDFDTCIDQTEFDNYFLQFHNITKRISPDDEQELIAIANDSLDQKSQIELMKALQELENIKHVEGRFKKNPGRFYCAKELEKTIKDIRKKIQTEKDKLEQDNFIIEIQFPNDADSETKAQILNYFKKEPNEGDFKIEFVNEFLWKVHSLHTQPETDGTIPPTILRMDKESVRIYKKALESGSEIKHDIRVIIVGKKGAGKTSLVRNLLKENLDNVDSTNGIDIHVKRCKIRIADEKWFFQEGSFISDVSQRMLRSMITQTSGEESPRIEGKNEYLEEFKEEETANQCEDTLDLNIVHPHLSVERATYYVQSRDTEDLIKLTASVKKQESSDVTDKTQHGRDLREIIDSAKDMDDEEYASLSFWDFAGDREYYTTHQTFLSEEAVYLVVTKLNETDDVTKETLKFWFDSVHFYGSTHNDKYDDSEQVIRPALRSHTENENALTDNASTQINDHHDVPDNEGKTTCQNDLNPPIIAIGTHKDQCKGNFRDGLRDQIRNNLGNSAARQHLRDCHYISNKTDEDNIFEVLRKKIYEIGKNMPGFGKLLPVRFIQLEKSIDGKLQTGTQFLSFDDVKAIAEKIGAITDIAELDVFLRYHHDFGNLIYFKDIPEYIILNPQWLVNVFRLLVTADMFRDKLVGHKEWDIYETTGKLTENLMRCIFANQTDDITKCKEHVLRIMEKFDIIIRPRMLIDGKELVDPHYYVPCMIKTIASKEILEQLIIPQHKSYCLCIEFDFLPPAFINHLMISCIRRFITSQFCWQKKNLTPALFRHTGLFDLNSCEKLLVASCKNFIQIQVWKYDSQFRTSYRDIRDFILTEIDKIRRDRYRLFRINYDVKIKCESTSYVCFDGIIVPPENGDEYLCNEHKGTHIYRDDWFSENKTTKRAAECQTEKERTIDQKKDEDISSFVIHVQKKMKMEASSTVEMNMAKMVKVALNILADVLFDLLKLETYADPRYQLCSRSQCDITFLYKEHRHMNKHIPSNSSKRRCPWGGEWPDIAVTDKALGDDIERIRLTRNELQHMKFFALDNTRYIELCTILQDMLKRFDQHINPSHLYTDRLNTILENTVEKEDVECFKLEIKSKL